MGAVGSTNNGSIITYDKFEAAANKYGYDADELYSSLEDYEESSYGGSWSELSNFIEDAKELHYTAGDIYRGIQTNSDTEYNNLLSKYTVGSNVPVNNSWMSWSADKAIAEDYSKGGSSNFKNSIVFVNNSHNKTAIATQDILGIRGKVGTDINGKWHDEAQILYSNKKSFKVTDVKKGKNVTYIYVNEN